MTRLLPSFCATLLLASCSTPPAVFSDAEADVVFALGPRDGFLSPMTAPLKPACPALEFAGSSFQLTGGHKRILKTVAEQWQQNKGRFLVAGYVPPEFSEDFARSLSERRAQAVRQHLIGNGVEAASMQTIGFGHDSSPSGPTTSVVVIYKE